MKVAGSVLWRPEREGKEAGAPLERVLRSHALRSSADCRSPTKNKGLPAPANPLPRAPGAAQRPQPKRWRGICGRREEKRGNDDSSTLHTLTTTRRHTHLSKRPRLGQKRREPSLHTRDARIGHVHSARAHDSSTHTQHRQVRKRQVVVVAVCAALLLLCSLLCCVPLLVDPLSIGASRTR